MSLNILIAPDKFKGTLTALAACEAIACGWHKARPKDKLSLLPISDGGDGFGSVVSTLLRARSQTIKTVDAAHRPLKANWWWHAKTKTAIIESANIIGLAMLPQGKFHPFQLDTFGLGSVLRAAFSKRAERIVIGIGGSATNDGGFGLARALGWEFLDVNGTPILQWTALHALAEIHPPKNRLWKNGVKIIVAVDVQNPLLGQRGATRIYGPQKGLRPDDFALADRCLRRLAQVATHTQISGLSPGKRLGVPASAGTNRLKAGLQTIPGAGAAGGLGFGLMAFAKARPENGFDLFAELAALSKSLRAADVVVTGEGMIDRSTLMGKGSGEIARRCRDLKLPCIGLAGSTDHAPGLRKLFTRVDALTDLTSSANAKARPAFWLERIAQRAAAALDFKP